MTTTPYYQDEHVTLWHGDCLAVLEWLNADAMVTDPPYGMAHVSGWNQRPIAGDASTDARDRVLELWGDKPAIVFGRWSEARPASTRARLVWDKGEWPGMGDLTFPWGPSDEEIYVLGSGWSGKREGTVLRANRLSGVAVADHPTPKPVSLMEKLVSKCPAGVIADPFAGSGSTLLAARNVGRRSIGVELEERYCEVIAKRLSQGVLDFGEATA